MIIRLYLSNNNKFIINSCNETKYKHGIYHTKWDIGTSTKKSFDGTIGENIYTYCGFVLTNDCIVPELNIFRFCEDKKIDLTRFKVCECDDVCVTYECGNFFIDPKKFYGKCEIKFAFIGSPQEHICEIFFIPTPNARIIMCNDKPFTKDSHNNITIKISNSNNDIDTINSYNVVKNSLNNIAIINYLKSITNCVIDNNLINICESTFSGKNKKYLIKENYFEIPNDNIIIPWGTIHDFRFKLNPKYGNGIYCVKMHIKNIYLDLDFLINCYETESESECDCDSNNNCDCDTSSSSQSLFCDDNSDKSIIKTMPNLFTIAVQINEGTSYIINDDNHKIIFYSIQNNTNNDIEIIYKNKIIYELKNKHYLLLKKKYKSGSDEYVVHIVYPISKHINNDACSNSESTCTCNSSIS